MNRQTLAEDKPNLGLLVELCLLVFLGLGLGVCIDAAMNEHIEMRIENDN